MAATLKEYFVTERAKALAQVLVTRRDDLAILENNTGDGFDYLLSIRRDPAHVPCQIGLVIESVTKFDVNEGTIAPPKEIDERIRFILSCYFPVVMFYFSARDDSGYYAWLWKPEFLDDGRPKLERQVNPVLWPLGNESLDEIVNTTKRWYDAVAEWVTK